MKKIICFIIIACAAFTAVLSTACDKKNDPVSKYDIFAVYDHETATLTGTVKFEYYNNTENELTDLKFNLYGNAFRENALYKPVSKTYENKAYYDGASYGGMTVSGVENCAGWNVSGEDENILTINLTEPVFPEERTTLTISYALKLAKVNHRTGVTAKTVNLGNFYPVLCAYSKEGFIEHPYYSYGDPFVSECSNYSVTLDFPAEYTAATSGKQESEKQTNDRKKCVYSLNGARDFAIVLSKEFNVISADADGVKVNYYYTADDDAENSLAAAAESLKYFSSAFGKYAYPSLSVVQTGFCYGGMEYPGLTMIADGLNRDSNIYTIVHETAHQWWYAMVGSDQINCAWQDEGLTEYSTLMFFENSPAYGFTRTGIVKSATSAYRAFFTVYSQLNGAADTSMTRCLKDFSGEFEYNNITYNKGLIMFETLREAIGDDAFTSVLREYFKNNCGKIASSDDMLACFVKKQPDLENFFNSFTEGKIII